jgi:hypothetical protein
MALLCNEAFDFLLSGGMHDKTNGILFFLTANGIVSKFDDFLLA